MRADAIGLDIGGANLKAATASGRARSRPFALWKHPDRLADELAALAQEFPVEGPVGVTMTGELCDCFETKREGVRHILAAVARAIPQRRLGVWSTDGRFLRSGEAAQQPMAVAAANWHALATFIGRLVPSGFTILVDIGSTTTDVIPVVDGRPAPAGHTDPERLRTNELVYTGVRRTPVCALLGSAVAAEFFATTHDVYLRLGLAPERPEDRDTADGRPATDRHAHARLARMLGGDPEVTSEAETRALAGRAHDRQLEMIAHAVNVVAGRRPRAPGTVVVAGSGEFLARAALQTLPVSRTPRDLMSMADRFGRELSGAACAYAVAGLARKLLA
jgi:hypothetical protein